MGVILLIGGMAALSHLVTQTVVPDEFRPLSVDLVQVPPEARLLQNPLNASEEVIRRGAAIYHSKGTCAECHGVTGRGDGEAGTLAASRPRNFVDRAFHAMRTDGELFWVLKEGIAGSGMLSFVPRLISEEEAWSVIHYLRTFRPTDMDLP